MEEIAFAMQLMPGMEAEYQRRHDAIWPELSEALGAAGIRDYAIYLHQESRLLFAVQKRLPGHTAHDLPSLPIMQKWWAYMADLMETNPDNSPVVMPLPCVFRLMS
ncbi:L-rhamnose mutarotase [Hymenobacter aerilatus]|uniref:L-rhamnose mutarotase n=1 Tax=Hymenobacter aerilatus TaxID=2932251 RepID=A0A8T9SZL1_9BACT|nr:L-rhamnose mutarotase [Hymenobacter aerilatus]UOR06143.1 L-rhamnose mutarotase [Hymenobacter aerilatus]